MAAQREATSIDFKTQSKLGIVLIRTDSQSDGTLTLYQAGDVLYNDLGPMEREHWSNHLVRFTAKADDIILTSESPAWKHIPSTYVISEEDLLYPEDLQRKTLEAAVAHTGTPTDDEFFDGIGHSAMISAPEKILAVVIGAAAKVQTMARLAPYDGADGADGTQDDVENEPCACGNGSEYARSCSSYQISDISDEEFSNEIYRATVYNCTCGGKCFCHHKKHTRHDDANPATLHPDCPYNYADYRHESLPDAPSATGTSSTDPLSTRETFETAYEYNYMTPEEDERDPYESWDSGLATIGSQETAETIIQDDTFPSGFGKRVEPLAEGDDSSQRSELKRSQSDRSDPPDSGVSEAGSIRSEPGQSSVKGKSFVKKLLRKTTTLPMGL
jgi:hypothetical protein